MNNRISTTAMNNSMINHLMRNQNTYLDIQNQILTNKKVNKPSDNPVDAKRILGISNQLYEYDMFARSITNATMQVNTLECTLDQTTEKLERAAELLMSASNETNTEETIRPIKNEMQAILDMIVSCANTMIDGQYIYSGANTETAAYAVDGINIKYQGSDADTPNSYRKMEIADGTYVNLNEPGINLFGEYYEEEVVDENGDPVLDDDGNQVIKIHSSGIIGTLMTSIRAMEGISADGSDSGEVVDFASVRDQIDVLKTQVTNLLETRAEFGTYGQKLEMAQSTIDENTLTLTEQRSNLQDVDLIQALSDLTYQDYVLQSSMKIGTTMLNNSLLDYI